MLSRYLANLLDETGQKLRRDVVTECVEHGLTRFCFLSRRQELVEEG